VELLPISSKRRTEVLSDATNQGIEVINQLKIEIVFSDGNGADFILELLRGFGSDAPGTAGVSRFSRLCAYASGPRGPVFREG
jgi:hypothetical protein